MPPTPEPAPATTPPPPTVTSWRPPARRLVAAVVIALAVALLLRAPLPGYVLRPGPAFSLGEQISVDGVDPLNGDYLFTTIMLDDATVASALGAAFDRQAQVVTRQAILDGEEEEVFVARQERLFEETEAIAVSLALDLVGSELPASAVTVTGDGVGGPSAGLLMTLAVADLLSGEDVAAGRVVSGTGSVTPDGSVTDVGSVADKVAAAEGAGADVFLVPRNLLARAEATGTAMDLVAVDSVAEALAALVGG